MLATGQYVKSCPDNRDFILFVLNMAYGLVQVNLKTARRGQVLGPGTPCIKYPICNSRFLHFVTFPILKVIKVEESTNVLIGEDFCTSVSNPAFTVTG
jgi:hypothetical protein